MSLRLYGRVKKKEGPTVIRHHVLRLHAALDPKERTAVAVKK